MGRIKSQQIKRAVKEFLTTYPDEFTSDFEKNKQKVMSRSKIGSKKLRNVIAGSITHHIKLLKLKK